MKIFGIELTDEEITDTAKNHFKSFSPLVLENYPAKLKKKAAILAVIKDIFEEGIIYTEKEVNELLKEIYPDYVTLRRALCDAGMLKRQPDGSEYWKHKY